MVKRAIWKFDLGISVYQGRAIFPGVEFILMPKGAKPLAVAMQHGKPRLWVLVDPDAELVQRSFLIAGTGHLRDDLTEAAYVGSVQLADGAYVFHVFDEHPEKTK